MRKRKEQEQEGEGDSRAEIRDLQNSIREINAKLDLLLKKKYQA
jgi:hypothetical protein